MERRVRDQQLGSCTLGSRLVTVCPDPITTTVEFEAAGLARVVYTECIDMPFALGGAYTLESRSLVLDDSAASWEGNGSSSAVVSY
jgi:hypothetical protein